jgi:hypothetical protein
MVQPGSPVGYNLIFTSRSNPLQWMTTFSKVLSLTDQVVWPNWQGAPVPPGWSAKFYRIVLDADDEGATTSWVNIQPYAHKAGLPTLWGNMQPEYR